MVKLDRKKEIELIKQVKEKNCSDSLNKLIGRHSAICLNVFQKYAPCFGNNYERFQDLIREKDYLIYRAALSFKPEKRVKFVTWLANLARYECLNSLNSKDNLFIPTENKELQYHVDSKIERVRDDKETEFIFSILGQLTDKRISKIFRLRYFNGNVSWSSIAKKMRISTQTAINLHEKGRTLLKHKLKSKECFDEI